MTPAEIVTAAAKVVGTKTGAAAAQALQDAGMLGTATEDQQVVASDTTTSDSRRRTVVWKTQTRYVGPWRDQ